MSKRNFTGDSDVEEFTHDVQPLMLPFVFTAPANHDRLPASVLGRKILRVYPYKIPVEGTVWICRDYAWDVFFIHNSGQVKGSPKRDRLPVFYCRYRSTEAAYLLEILGSELPANK